MEATSQPVGVNLPAATSAAEPSPWHSPVPYLFGGLAAMLGLIAFALLILACSYWKLSGHLENGENDDQRDLEAGEGGETEEKGKKKQYEEKVLVIMAGQVKPTFLATPVTSRRTSSFGDDGGSEKTCRCGEKLDGEKQGNSEEEEESGNRGGLRSDDTTTH